MAALLTSNNSQRQLKHYLIQETFKLFMSNSAQPIIEIQLQVNSRDVNCKASALLAAASELSQQQIKDAMQKGGVWLLRNKKRTRLRRASKQLQSGDALQLYYNPSILQQTPIVPELISDEGEYSIWFKPYGSYCQGSNWGDFCAINRWVETHFQPQRPCFLVHRLDRATSGLLILAHSKLAAQKFSHDFAQRTIQKHYQAIVNGDASSFKSFSEINIAVDGKKASTLWCCEASHHEQSLINIKLNSGRKHQIRQHLSAVGFPIIGDRLYGKQKEHSADLQLQAISLAFICPITGIHRHYHVPEKKMLQLKKDQ